MWCTPLVSSDAPVCKVRLLWCMEAILPLLTPSHAGSGVKRIEPVHFLARCLKTPVNQALSVLSLSLDFFNVFCDVY